ncbi:MAG: Ig-like domain-containing protein [Hyphomicrobium sp.]|nr:Ig-like domain-containing protein [Hyphomicrobium sp.]
MAVLVGTTANDVMSGTIDADRIEGGAGNDRINGGAGNDDIFGGLGADILTGDAGDDRIYGEDGNDGIYGGGGNDLIDGGIGNDILLGDGGNDVMSGGEGNDRLSGGTGNDTLAGGAGDDLLQGEAGDDTFVVQAGQGVDTIVGGEGFDRLLIALVGGDVTEALRADLAAYQTWSSARTAAETTSPTFTFSSLGLTVSTVEALDITVDGVARSLASFLNQAPTGASSVFHSTDEDRTLSGTVSATDPDGDVLTYTIVTGPNSGSLALDADTGAFSFAPPADWSGSDRFTVRVTDTSGASFTQDITVAVNAVADAPVLIVADAVAVHGDVIIGGAGNDTIRGDGANMAMTAALDIAAALRTPAQGETLEIVIGGVPSGASLSVGVRNSDGTWTLGAGDLDQLTLILAQAGPVTLTVTAIAEVGASMAATSGILNVTAASAVTSDTIYGADGNDAIYGGGAGDTLIGGGGNDKVYGEAGDDWIVDGLGNDAYDGGDGFDTLDFSARGAGVTVDLAAGTATGDDLSRLKGIEGIVGTRLGDTITGSKLANVLSDGAGSDFVNAAGGDDTVLAGGGNDRLIGGSGIDTLDYSGALSGLGINIGKSGSSGFSSDSFTGFERYIGSDYADTFTGSSRAETIDAGGGNDWIRGLGGADFLTGGEGADTFVWLSKDIRSGNTHLGVDHVTDFGSGDKLDLTDFGKSVKKGDYASVFSVKDGTDGTTVSVQIANKTWDVAVLENVHGMTLQSMLADGLLIV